MTLDGKILRGLFEHEILKIRYNKKESGKCIKLTSIKASSKYRHDSIVNSYLQR